MFRRWTASRRRRKTAFLLLGICALIFLVYLYRYISFNLWLDSDSRSLRPYEIVLVENSARAVRELPDTDLRAIENVLIEVNTANRLVVHLSRSDVRFGLLKRRAYVKVFLETGLPGEPDKVQRIKVLNVLKPVGERWQLVSGGVIQLTIP
jgi:hypothetical protein